MLLLQILNFDFSKYNLYNAIDSEIQAFYVIFWYIETKYNLLNEIQAFFVIFWYIILMTPQSTKDKTEELSITASINEAPPADTRLWFVKNQWNKWQWNTTFVASSFDMQYSLQEYFLKY